MYDNLLTWKGHGAWYLGPNGQPFISSFSSGGLTGPQWATWKKKYANGMYLVPDIDDTLGYNTSDAGWWAYWLVGVTNIRSRRIDTWNFALTYHI